MKAALGLLALVGTASAKPAATVDNPSPPRVCKPSGAVLFEVAQRADPKRKVVTATTKLYSNGAFTTHVFDVDRKVMRTTSGCLDRVELEGIREDLAGAVWKTTRTQATCSSSGVRFTVFRWRGKLLYTERTCNTNTLDQDSQQVLERIKVWLRVPDDLDGAREPPRRLPPLECVDNPLAKGCM